MPRAGSSSRPRRATPTASTWCTTRSTTSRRRTSCTRSSSPTSLVSIAPLCVKRNSGLLSGHRQRGGGSKHDTSESKTEGIGVSGRTRAWRLRRSDDYSGGIVDATCQGGTGHGDVHRADREVRERQAVDPELRGLSAVGKGVFLFRHFAQGREELRDGQQLLRRPQREAG